MDDSYPRTGKTLYLNIVWHQHQPLYLDPESDQLQGPWVRTHGTKDYYDMAAILEKYPDIHFTVNLTSSLLVQLQTYYVKRLVPFLNRKKNRIDEKKYFSKYAGKTDPWIDIALKNTAELGERELRYLLENVWNALGINDTIIARFPQYRGLKEKFARVGKQGLTEQDLREIKFWFFLAYFDPDFLDQKQELPTGTMVDLTDLIKKDPEGTYTLKKTVGEEDCNRIVAETCKILAAIVPVHKKLMYHPDKYKGQIEILTTPFYHPILPLVYDSDLAKLCQPNDPMPTRLHYPKDAEMQVLKAIQAFKKFFGMKPTGMWPAEGAVAHDIVSVFAHQGIQWIATDQKILERSKPGGQSALYPYVIESEPDSKSKTAVIAVFRETALSDKIGFVYKDFQGEDAADDFIREVLKYSPKDDERDRLLTVILDGENAWEWYRYDNDGKCFQNALYRKLANLFRTRQIVTTTVTEYIRGNPLRGIPAHPPEMLPKIEWLWPGSWINANFDTWIGEDEENRAWEYLLQAREDLAQSGLQQPDPKAKMPKEKTKAWYVFQAWESLYAAEGSDWFWWYGTDQNAPAGDKPFDLAFVTHLRNIYKFAKLAGSKMPKRDFKPIIAENAPSVSRPGQGTMTQSKDDTVRVTFQCDARGMYVRKYLYIVGNHERLGNWVPNKVRMHDDGTHGDLKASDSIWTVEIDLPSGIDIEYKYTNSGAEGSWDPGQEFAFQNRKIRIESKGLQKMTVIDKFGQL